MKQLILGGARSGKSVLAEQLASQSGKTVIYVATCEARDAEMVARIQQHRAQRPSHWQTIEEPRALANVLNMYNDAQYCVLVDCLTLWVTNCLLSEATACWLEQKEHLLNQINTLHCEVILVSNEVGQGVIPLGEISRQFVDETGWLHQALAKQCERVVWVVAGLPQVLKGSALNLF